MSAQTLPHRQHQPDRGWGILEHGTYETTITQSAWC